MKRKRRRTKIISPKHMVLIGSLFLAAGLLIYWGYTVLANKTSISALATVTKDVQYCNTNSPSQSFDMYRPKSAGTMPTPLVVYIHGGGWRSGDKKNSMATTYVPLFLQHGVSVISLNYRLNSPSPYPDQNDDIACALTYINDRAGELHVDTKKMLYFGESAGGQLASFAALHIPYKQYDYEAPLGVIDFYGVSDFSTIVDSKRPDLNARRYLGSKYNKVVRDASPTTYVTKKAPKFLIVHGMKDIVVPSTQSQTLYDSLIKVGIDAEYVKITNAGHGFIGPELSPADYARIRTSLKSFLAETIAQ